MRIDPNRLFVPMRALGAKDIDLFAGREEELRNLFEAISVRGSTVVVYGERGVGKTTLARVAESAIGGNEKAAEHARTNLSYLRPERFASFWVECDQRCDNFNDILRKLLRRPGQPITAKEQEGRTRAARPKISADISDWELEGEFRDWVDATRDELDIDEVVIFIDEFDRLPDKRHVGEIAKNADGFKFVLVGIGEVVQDLVDDHESLARAVETVPVPLFNNEEVAAIFKNASEAADREATYPRLSFSKAFSDNAFEDSGGFPWLVQQIGHAAVRNIGDIDDLKKPIKLTQSHYDKAVDALFSARHADVSDSAALEIRNALAHSSRALALLKAVADTVDGGVPSTTLLSRLRGDQRVGFYDALDQLVEKGILQRSTAPDKHISFTSPMKRLLVRLLLRRGLDHIEKAGDNA